MSTTISNLFVYGNEIEDNIIVDSIKTKFSRGMDIKNADDGTYMQNIVVNKNHIYNMYDFSIIIRKSQNIKVTDNYCEGGKGILLYNCNGGEIADNLTKNTGYHIVNESVSVKEINNKIVNDGN